MSTPMFILITVVTLVTLCPGALSKTLDNYPPGIGKFLVRAPSSSKTRFQELPDEIKKLLQLFKEGKAPAPEPKRVARVVKKDNANADLQETVRMAGACGPQNLLAIAGDWAYTSVSPAGYTSCNPWARGANCSGQCGLFFGFSYCYMQCSIIWLSGITYPNTFSAGNIAISFGMSNFACDLKVHPWSPSNTCIV